MLALVTRMKKLSRALVENALPQFAVAVLEHPPSRPASKPNRIGAPLALRFGETPLRVQSASDVKAKLNGLTDHAPLLVGCTAAIEVLAR